MGPLKLPTPPQPRLWRWASFLDWRSSVFQSRRRGKASSRSVLLATVSVLSLTGTIGYRYYNEPRLTVDTLAPSTILAPESVSVVDKAATAEAQTIARQSALSVFTINDSATDSIRTNFTERLTQVQSLRAVAGPFPFVPTTTLSLETQRTLRRLDRSQVEALLAAVEASDRPGASSPTSLTIPAMRQSWLELTEIYQAADQQPQWRQLAESILMAQSQYQRARRSAAPELAVLDLDPLLSLTDDQWRAAQGKLLTVLRRMLAQGIAPGLLPNVTQRAIEEHLSDQDLALRRLALQLLPSTLRSNLILDPVATLQRQEQAAQSIQPVRVSIRQGEVIVKAGEPITSAEFALLDHFGLSRRELNVKALLLTATAVGAALVLFILVQGRRHQRLSHQDDALLLLMALSAPLMVVLTGMPFTSLPAVGLLAGNFYGSRVGVMMVVLLTLLMPIGIQTGELVLVAIATASVVGSILAGFARSREELARAGLILGVIEAVVYGLLLGGTNLGLYQIMSVAGRQGMIGLGWCIVALGLSPYLEKFFDLITPIRLAELANPNRPLLKRLAEKAPGTFQHTQFVATLAEAGARALGGNVELVRTGTLYHDIGKLHDPQAFIENQFGAPNKHENLDNPWQSAKLIRKHVTEGIVMARKSGLPSAVQAFIPEHQGTMLIAYFYYQAQQRAQSQPEVTVEEEDFRYAGPIPQSLETGIVMLADSCEAALRSMKQPDPKLALRTVKQIFKARWEDQQLVDTPLTREDLHRLAGVFVEVWQQVNHQRIAYPKPLVMTPPAAPS